MCFLSSDPHSQCSNSHRAYWTVGVLCISLQHHFLDVGKNALLFTSYNSVKQYLQLHKKSNDTILCIADYLMQVTENVIFVLEVFLLSFDITIYSRFYFVTNVRIWLFTVVQYTSSLYIHFLCPFTSWWTLRMILHLSYCELRCFKWECR